MRSVPAQRDSVLTHAVTHEQKNRGGNNGTKRIHGCGNPAAKPPKSSETVYKASLSNLHTHEATGSSPVVSTKNHRNRLIPVIFFYNLQLFVALNFRRFIKTHTLTHTGKGAESTEQGRAGFFLSGPVFLPHLLADDPADGVCGVLLHLGRSVGVRAIMYPKSLQRTISIIRDFARRQLSCSARSEFLAFPGGTTL